MEGFNKKAGRKISRKAGKKISICFFIAFKRFNSKWTNQIKLA
jgi:hypothetical protein